MSCSRRSLVANGQGFEGFVKAVAEKPYMTAGVPG